MSTIFGQFELLGNIGSGSMAELFKARNIHDKSVPVLVVKRVRPEFRYDTNLMARFVEGAQSVVGLAHPNIATVFDAGVMVGRFYVALEYIHGRDLRHIQAQFQTTRRALPIPLALFVMTEVCRALEYAHNAEDEEGDALDVVHCDVSTQNIKISFEGAVKLINLEGAWFRKKSWASTKGKCAYMSPEQAANEDVDPRSDIFSAGIVFWEIATGKRLFGGTEDEEIRAEVEQAEILAPSSANRLVPKDLESIILKALSRDPNNRYKTARAMREALERFADKSRLTFSSKQLAGWMKMTFGADAKGGKVVKPAAPAAPPKVEVAPPAPAAPVLEGDDDAAAWGDDDEATRIDPTSGIIAEQEFGPDDVTPASEVVVPAEARSGGAGQSPTAENPAVSAALAEDYQPQAPNVDDYQPQAPDVDDDPDDPDDPLADEPETTETLPLDEIMKERRRLEKRVRTQESPGVGAKMVAAGASQAREGRRVDSDASAPSEIDERDAGSLDDVIKDQRSFQRRVDREGQVQIRFERRSAGDVVIDERSSMLQILIIVGTVLVLGLGILTYMILTAEEGLEDDDEQVLRLRPDQVRAVLLRRG